MTDPLAGVDDFFETYWEERLLHLEGVVDTLPITLDDVDRLLADHVLTTSTVVASKNGSIIDNRRITVDPTILAAGSTGPQTVIDPDRLVAEFQRGASISFQRIEEFVPTMAAAALQIEEVVGHPVRGNAFLTPPNAPGLGIHIDGTDVFVVQCVGTKRWEVWERDILRPLSDDVWPRTDIGPPEHVIELQPGDMMYLPRGWRHRVAATTETSLSVSLNLRSVSRAHIARAAVTATTRADDDLRVALQPDSMVDDEALVAEVKDTIGQLVDKLEALDPAVIADQIRALVHEVRRPVPSVTIRDAIAAIGLGDEHRIGLADGVEIVGDELRRGEATAKPPTSFIEALALSEVATVGAVRGELPGPVAERLVKKLIETGWLRSA